MLRDVAKTYLDHDPHFAWRGHAVTRIENLSDIVFALALGMLVSSSAPPQTMRELHHFLFSIIPVSAGFGVLLLIWNDHFVFFRRYGLADGKIVFLNSALLFVVLFLAYPLRFAFESFFGFVLLTIGDSTYVDEMEVGYNDSGVIMAYFAAGYCAFNVLICAMYCHALSKAGSLNLSPNEIALTRQHVYAFVSATALSIAIGALAYFTPLNGFAGFLLVFVGVAAWIISKVIKLPDPL